MVHFSLECSARELVVTKPHTPPLICGCLVVGVLVGLSYDIEHPVAS